MSFILQLLHAPCLLSLDEAVAQTSEVSPADEAMRQRFERFQRGITRHYPDLSEDDEDGDDPSNAWGEGLVAKYADESVWVIAPKLEVVDEVFMGHVALAAAEADLHVLDPQNGHLYRPDRTRVGLDGRVVQLPTPP